eukprot:2237136-Amphidinium_carterae.1
MSSYEEVDASLCTRSATASSYCCGLVGRTGRSSSNQRSLHGSPSSALSHVQSPAHLNDVCEVKGYSVQEASLIAKTLLGSSSKSKSTN